MNDSKQKILLKGMVKTSTGKLILKWCLPSTETDKFKGFNDFDMWFDNCELFDKLNSKDFGIPLEAVLGYSEPDFRGKCSLIIKKLDINGRNIIS